ncbi:MDR family oxidoreductase [Lichenicoccus sp.]|uniref:acrylyl-CoA reductase (NADPH) n=1 Tax=Lichenicoccus sp. TaxID=2781899 RepID=UPI003D0C4C48
MVKGWLIEKTTTGTSAALASLDEADLPDGDVTVAVAFSSMNYKDALALTGAGPVVRTFPMVPGVDLAGIVLDSTRAGIAPGDRVILNGTGIGETRWGGLAQKARVQGEWLVPLPHTFSMAQAMAVGTAGFTAMLCVIALERHGVRPGDGEILVTGAAGGVGSVALALLGRLGYRTVACTGRVAEAAYLERLGAGAVIDRATLSAPGKPLQTERWTAAIDTVGSHTLANVCAGLRRGGIVAACGMAQGLDFPASVAPFILRNVTLAGIDSVKRPIADRLEAWDRLARDLDPALLDAMTTTHALEDARTVAETMLRGAVRGRVVVDVNR